MKTQYICLVALIALFAQFVTQAEAAGIFDSLTGGSKKKNKKKKTRDDTRAEYEEIAKEVMSDKTIKNTPPPSKEDDLYGKVPKKGKKKDDKGWIDSLIPESLYDPLPNDDAWQKEWDQAMHNFFPEDQIKFLLPAKKTITWHMDVTSEQPVHVRGAYQVNQGMEGDREQYRINVVVLDQYSTPIYKKNFMDIGIIAFDTTGPGEYTFTFSSFGMKGGDREVLFMLHEDYLETANPDIVYPSNYEYKDHHEKVVERGDNDYLDAEKTSTAAKKVDEPKITEEQAAILADQLEDQDTVVMKKSLKSSLDDLKMMSREAKMSLDTQLVHNDNVNVNFTFHVWVLVIEIIVVLLIAVFYVWNIQKMVDNKLLL